MDDAWEDWIRPLLLIVVAALAVLVWYLEWVPDGVFGLALGALVAVVAAVAVGARVVAHAATPAARWVGLLVVFGSLALAGWSPWRLLGPDAVVAAGDVGEDGGRVALPGVGAGKDAYRVYLHGEPHYGKADAELRLTLWTRPGEAHVVRHGRVDTRQSGQGRAARTVRHHDLSWDVAADLSEGGRIEVHEVSERQLEWPVHVELRRAPAPVGLALTGGALLLALGLLVERRATKRQRMWLTTLAVATPLFTALFGLWFSPGNLTKAVFGAALAATLIGAFVSYPLLAVARRIGARPPPASTAEAPGGSA